MTNLSALGALRLGVSRAAKGWRFLLLFYVFNFAAAAVLAAPIAEVFSRDITRSLAGLKLLSGFSYSWYVDFVHANEPIFRSLLPQVIVIIVVYLAVEVYFAGGFYSIFSTGKKGRVGDFLSRGASSFFQLLAVTAAEVCVLALVYEGNLLWASLNETASRNALHEYTVLRGELWRYGIVAVFFLAVNLIFDFIRVAVVLDEDDYWSKIKRGVGFAVEHPVSTLGTYLGSTLIGLLAIGLMLLFNFNLRAGTEGTVYLELAAGQIFILLRIFSKLIFYASEAVLYKEDQIEVIKVKAEMLE